MKILILALATGWLLLFTGCKGGHLINDENYRKVVNTDFLARKELAKAREQELFSSTGKNLSDDRREAMEFLLAYSPLSDLAEYNSDFFLENADLSLKTRRETPWGPSIPESVFLHYVLPPRVNNENLDRFRIEYFNEISSRIKGLDAKSAALELNHWCHEKVSYQPSDIRTSAPLSTILSARGRCGEESTFAVATLRTAGLPARQVYTPRWAHSDDNHAWVEVWVDGKWHFIGACEPDADLDLAFGLDGQATGQHLIRQHTLIHGFLVAGADAVVNGHGRTDDLVRHVRMRNASDRCHDCSFPGRLSTDGSCQRLLSTDEKRINGWKRGLSAYPLDIR